MVRLLDVGQVPAQDRVKHLASLRCDNKRTTGLVLFNKAESGEGNEFCFRQNLTKVFAPHILTPAKKSQRINIPLAKNQDSLAPFSFFPAYAENALAPFRRKDIFGFVLRRGKATNLLPYIEGRLTSPFLMPVISKSSAIISVRGMLTPNRFVFFA